MFDFRDDDREVYCAIMIARWRYSGPRLRGRAAVVR